MGRASCWMLVSGALLLSAGCGSPGDAPPTTQWNGPCPTTTEGIQTEILTPMCGSSGCHGVSVPALGLDLVSAGLNQRLLGVSASGCGDKLLIAPGNPTQSYLLEKMTQAAPTCGDPMPLGGPSLSPAQLTCLQSWVAQVSGGGKGTGGASGSGGGGGSGGMSGGSGGAAAPGSGGMIGATGGATRGATGGGTSSTGGSRAGTGGARTGTGGMTAGSGGATASTGGTKASTGGATGTGGAVAGSGGAVAGTGGAKAGTGGSTGTGGCGPTVSFANQVQPIFTANCANSGCHSGTRPSAGLSLASGASYAELVNVASSSSCTSLLLVKPGQAAQSYLMNKLLGTGICSGSQMPKAGVKLPSTSISAITGWICEGAPKN